MLVSFCPVFIIKLNFQRISLFFYLLLNFLFCFSTAAPFFYRFKQGKQRQDSIEQYRAASRPDLAEREAAELAILQEYLPKPLTPEELEAAVEEAVRSTGAASPQDMGRVMSAIMASHKGRVDGKTLSAAVRQRLSGK